MPTGAGPGRHVGQGAEHVLRSAVAPYNSFATSEKKEGPGGSKLAALGKAARDQLLDIKDVSPKSAQWERKAPGQLNKQVTQRYKKGGSGPLEELIDHIFGR